MKVICLKKTPLKTKVCVCVKQIFQITFLLHHLITVGVRDIEYYEDVGLST